MLSSFIHMFNNLGKTDSVFNELEIKLLYDQRINRPKFVPSIDYTYLIKSMIKPDIKTKQTINFIKNGKNCMFVKQFVYENGIRDKSKTNYYKKQSLCAPFYMIEQNCIPCKVTLNKESAISDDMGFDFIRFRSRQSTILGEWRLDITYVNTLNSHDILQIKKYRDFMFTQCMTEIDIKKISHVEVELEFIGSVLTIESFNIINNPTLNQITITRDACIRTIANVLNNHTSKKIELKHVVNNPIELSQKTYKKMLRNIDEFYITDKIDGYRVVLFIYSEVMYILSGKQFKSVKLVEPINNESFPIILDAEMTVSENIHDIDEYHVFDIIEKTSELNDTFEKRLSRFNNLINKLAKNGLRHKRFHKIVKYSDIKDFYLKNNTTYKTDGLILIRNGATYSQTKNYKWKDKTTIDFLAKKCPQSLLGINPYIIKPGKSLYLLFCGMSKKDYHTMNIEFVKNYSHMFKGVCNKYNKLVQDFLPIQFEPSLNKQAYLCWLDNNNLDNKIIELYMDNNEWVLDKVRHDKDNDVCTKLYYGNYHKVAETLFMNYINPLTIDDISQPTDIGYFHENNNNMINIRKFNNYVKRKLLTSMRDKSRVIDLAAGQGQDLPKYIDAKVSSLCMIDIDVHAISELVVRKHYYISDCNKKRKKLPNIDLRICDLNQPYKKTVEIINKPAPLIICNFALHYLTNTKKRITNIANLINNLLNKKGMFIFTAFDGESIHKLFASEHYNHAAKTWELGQYAIKKMYASETFTGTNQKIGVKLPFSDGKLYEEYLINIDYLVNALEKKKIQLIASDSFKIYLPAYKKKMTDEDKTFVSLYNFYVFQKK